MLLRNAQHIVGIPALIDNSIHIRHTALIQQRADSIARQPYRRFAAVEYFCHLLQRSL